jgi:GNAT superfamily N-acetyltransferase
LELSDFTFVELTDEYELGNFNSGVDDITNFLFEDSKNYQRERMANTYLFVDDNHDIVAFFCISNDCLVDKGEEKGFSNKIFNRFHKKIKLPNPKRIRQYPAIKVGRLGVDEKYHRTGLSYDLMDFIKGFSLKDHKPACRLLLLDALNKERQIKYYEKNGFTFLLEDDVHNENRIMYFDLLHLA